MKKMIFWIVTDLVIMGIIVFFLLMDYPKFEKPVMIFLVWIVFMQNIMVYCIHEDRKLRVTHFLERQRE